MMKEKNMRIIPKKIKVKNTVWKCYSMPDILIALVMFAIIFILITSGNWIMAAIIGLGTVIMFMPTPDGIFYSYIIENIKFIVCKKKYIKNTESVKESINTLTSLKGLKKTLFTKAAQKPFGS